MKKIITTMAAVAALCLPAMAAYDGRVDISSNNNSVGTTPGGGGPFRVQIDTSFATSAEMNKVVAMGNWFLSYCLERNENIDLTGNQNYYAVISDAARAGGVGGAVGNPSSDPISKATAYLYSQFRAGSALFKNAQNQPSPQKYADLQNAIWWLEQEILDGQRTAGGIALINAAVAATGAGTAANARTINANGAYGVRVLNLYGSLSTAGNLQGVRQDQLVIVPEPSTYVAAALLMIPVISQVRRMRRSA